MFAFRRLAMTTTPLAATIVIREARPTDLPALVALLADDPLGRGREQNTDPLPPVYAEALADIAAHSGNFVLVAESGGMLVGCLQLTVTPAPARRGMRRGQIEGVRVAAQWRGRRLGERLIRHAIGVAREEGCGLVQLTSDASRTEAHRFYERLGFVASHVGMKLALA